MCAVCNYERLTCSHTEPFVPYWFVVRAQSRGSSNTEVVKKGVTFTKEGGTVQCTYSTYVCTHVCMCMYMGIRHTCMCICRHTCICISYRMHTCVTLAATSLHTAPLSPVANVRGHRINGTFAIISWTALSFEVARGFPLYIVHWTVSGSGQLAATGREQREGEEEMTSASSTVIHGLLLAAQYTVTVTAATHNGDLRGPPSEEVVIEGTLPHFIFQIPRAVSVQSPLMDCHSVLQLPQQPQVMTPVNAALPFRGC